jgi:hypothetical protein
MKNQKFPFMIEIELCTPLDCTQKSFPACVVVIVTAKNIAARG